MPPTAVIDHSLQPDTKWFFALEEGSIWRAENIDVTGTVFVQCMLALEGATFHRIISPSNDCTYALATLPNDGGDNDAKLYVSKDHGLTWQVKDVAENIGVGAEYRVTTGQVEVIGFTGDRLYYSVQHTRYDSEDDVNPWGIAFKLDQAGTSSVGLASADADGIHPGVESLTLGDDGSAILPVNNWIARVNTNTDLTDEEENLLTATGGWFSQYFEGSQEAPANNDGDTPGATWRRNGSVMDISLPNVATRIWHNFFEGTAGGDGTTTMVDSYVFWKYQMPIVATALASAANNPSIVYVGFEDTIVKSENFGDTWEVLTDQYGAYDIAVKTNSSRTIAFLTPDGDLRTAIDGVVQTEVLQTETPLTQAHRLIYDRLNGTKLWVLLNNGSTLDLKMYNGSSWTTLQSGIPGAKGLNTVPIRESTLHRIVYLSDTDIYYSENDGIDVTAKQGDWAGYASPVMIDLIVVMA